MTTYPNLNNESEFFKIKTQAEELENLKYQTKKHDHENILNSLKIDIDTIKRSIKV